VLHYAVSTTDIQAVFSEAVVKGSFLDTTTPSKWSVFVSSTLPVATANYVPVSVRMYAVDSLSVTDFDNSSVVCSSDSTAVRDIVDVDTLDQTIDCDGHSWSISACSAGNPSIPSYCVDCDADTCDGNCSFGETYGLYPGGSSCDLSSEFLGGLYDVNFIRVLVVTYRSPLPAPGIDSITHTVGRTNATLTVQLADQGIVYCHLYADGASPASSTEVKLANFAGETNADNVTVIYINNLVPATTYGAACVTLSVEEVQMLESVFLVQPLHAVTTECCKEVSVQLDMISLQTNEQYEDALTFTLDSLPSTLASLDISFGFQGVENSTDLFHPLSVSFTNQSTSLSARISFLGASAEVDADLELVLGGAAAGDYSVVFTTGRAVSISTTFVPPSAPVLQSAKFSTSGSLVTVTFDSATDRNLNTATSFVCCSIFSFNTCTASTCFWSSASKVTIYPSATGTVLTVGSSLSLLTSTLRPECTVTDDISNCSTWDYATAATVVVAAPANPVNPVVSMSVPATIGSCLDLVISLTSSTGNGGRAWSSRVFTVTSSNPNTTVAAVLQTFLNDNYVFAPATAIPHELLGSGFSYLFRAQLCNFLGSCSFGSTSVTVLANIVPSVTILGQNIRTVAVSSKLTVAGSAFTPQCDGSQSTVNLQYFHTVKLNNVAQLDLVSTSLDPTVLQLPAYSLTAGVVYTVSLSVLNSVTSAAATSTITVSVAVGDLVVIIAGGVTRSLVQSSNPTAITLDASNSFDEDIDPSTGGNENMVFTWKCRQTAPTFSSTCPFELPSSLLGETLSINYIEANGVTAKGVVTVTMFDGSGRTSSDSVAVDIISASAPQVSIASSFTGTFPNQNQLSITGSILLADAGTAVWTSDYDDLSLSSVALTSTSQAFNSVSQQTQFPVGLVISAGSLPERTTITFTLTGALSVDSTTKSSTSVVITTSGPPVPGVLLVSPATGGIALDTTFDFSADLWTGDADPLTYEFGFVSSTGKFIAVQQRSEATSCKANLPAGLESNGYLRAVRMNVYDSVDASTTIETTVEVLPLVISDQALQAKSNAALLAAGNANSISQVVGMVNEFLNAVNCTLASDSFCASVNREVCSSTEHTCGFCLDGFFGVYGDSNNLCVSDTARRRLVDSTPLTCQNDCNSQGSCYFRDIDTGATVDTCTVSSATCMAVCSCNSGFHGTDCSYTASSLETVQATRLGLLQSLFNMTQMQNVNDQTVSAWISQLNSNTQVPDELSIDGLTVAYQVLVATMEALSDTTVSTATAVDALTAMDRLATVLSGTTNGLSNVVVSTSEIGARNNLFDLYASYVTSKMVAGQQDIVSIFQNFRVLSGVRAIASGVPDVVTVQTFESDLSGAEVANNVQPQTVIVPILNDYSVGSQEVEVSQMVTRSFLYNNTDVFNSDPVHFNVKGLPCTYDGSESCNFTLVLENYRSVAVSATDEAESGATFITVCDSGDTSVHDLVCSDSHNETATCAGVAGEIHTRCPNFREVSSCAAVQGTGISAGSCVMQEYTTTNTTCECQYADSTASAIVSLIRDHVSVLETISEGYEQVFLPYTSAPTSAPSAYPTRLPTGEPSGQPTQNPTTPTSVPTNSPPTTMPSGQPSGEPSSAPSGVPSQQPTSPTSQPSAQPSSAPNVVSYAFALTDYMTDTCFPTCEGIQDLTGDTLAVRSEFCGLYQEHACSPTSVESFNCMPDCMPSYECGSTFCSTFAILSESCFDVHPNSTRINQIRAGCLSTFAAQNEEAGLGNTIVSFGLSFTMAVTAADLEADPKAVEAITSTVSQLITGVTSITDVSVIGVVRNLKGRFLVDSSSRIVMTVTGMSSGSVGISSGEDGAQAMVDEFANTVESSAFSTALTSNANAFGATALSPDVVTSVSASSVVRDTSIPVEFESASPTFAPTAGPAKVGFFSLENPDFMLLLYVVAGVLALILAAAGYRYYMHLNKKAAILSDFYNSANIHTEFHLDPEPVEDFNHIEVEFEDGVSASDNEAEEPKVRIPMSPRSPQYQVGDDVAHLGGWEMTEGHQVASL